MIRLQKYISESGYTSRRKAEELIKEGRVTVNNKLADIGMKIDEEKDIVEIDNVALKREEKKVYIMLNKPTGYLSSVTDDRGRKTVVDLVKVDERVFPVGRLDYDTEGLLILTNDGEFTYKITHPKFEITKTYIATLNKKINISDISLLKEGVEIEDYIGIAKEADIVNEEKKEVMITIAQGKNRQVRKMLEKVGYKVVRLKRISIGKLMLGKLNIGEWKYLNKNELDKLTKI